MNPKSSPSSLWAVHAVTIGVSTLGAYVFAAWSLRVGGATGRGLDLGVGVFALVVAVALSAYLVRFMKRFGVSRTSRRSSEPEDPFEHSP